MPFLPPPKEHRARKRVKIDLLVNRYVDGEPYMCRALDISAGGMRVEPLLEPGPTGSRYVGLEFQLPGSGQVVTAAGELVAAPEPGRAFGIRFTRLPPATASLLAAFTG